MNRLWISLFIACFIVPDFVRGAEGADIHRGNWLAWRGPLQTGVSLESFEGGQFDPEPVWTDDIAGQGTAVIFKGRLYTWGYRGEGPDLVEVLQARDEKTGKVIWERESLDYLSDTIYDRYTIGAPAIDPETENVIVGSAYGLVTCYSREGDIVWEISMMERYGGLTFPNARAGAPVIDGDVVIVRGVTSYWGADGPARDRFFGFDKRTGEFLWGSVPGVGPEPPGEFLKDTSMSTPFLETRQGRRVFYTGTGCGNVICVNVNDGTPLWRFQMAKGGINSSLVVLGDKILGVHGRENIDTTEIGRLFALAIPPDLDASGAADDPAGGAPRLPASAEIWRNPIEMFTSSPVLHDGRMYQINKTGTLYCVEAESGKTLWELKLANSQLHASPAYVDGMLIVPVFPGELHVIDVTGDEPKTLHRIDLEGNCNGSPAICNGRVYVHTTEKLYCFQIKNEGVRWAPAPEDARPVPGEAARLMAIPGDVLLKPGDSAKLRLVKIDAFGNRVGIADAAAAEWSKFVPPTARVASEMDASIAGGVMSADADARPSAGAWKVSLDGLEGFLRGRVIANLPYEEDFESFTLGDKPGGSAPGRAFDFPPLPWIGARLKWEVLENDGNKVLSKTLDRVMFQRSLSFIGDPEMSHYTLRADVMTDGSRRVKSTVGLINQRYIIALVGNSNILEVSSNYERFRESVPFPIAANQWYTLETRVDVADDGSGVVRAKAWKKGDPEPDAWTIEVNHKIAHRKGSPGLFGFSPQALKSVFIDNISITGN